MAVFMVNVCKFEACGRVFSSLADLILHIENTHIDYDPLVIEQKEASRPSCIHLSYILRFYTEASKRENTTINSEVRRKLASVVKAPSVRSSTPTVGSEFDVEIVSSQSEDSNDSWTTAEEFSSEYILKHGSRINTPLTNASHTNGVEKPFACPVPGCKKRYKNINGIKYHSKNGHKKEQKVRKGYRCPCGKSYKTAQGLKNHSLSQHTSSQSPASVSSIASQNPKSLTLPMMKALQGLVSSSHNQSLQVNNSTNQMKQRTHVDASQINTKAIRTMLDNINAKATKDNFSTLHTIALPRNTIGNVQINVPDIVNNNNISILHTKLETDVSSNVDLKPSQSPVFKGNHSSQNVSSIENNILPNNSLGILTPASSPISNLSDKVVKFPKDESNQLKVCHSPSHLSVSGHIFPLTPVTPGDLQNNFIVPSNVH